MPTGTPRKPFSPEKKAAIAAKRRQTMLERHGTTVFGAANSNLDKTKREEITKKRAKTLLEKNGTLSTKINMTDEEKRIANEKREATNLERYGVKNAFQADEKKEKIKQTNLERYGVENCSQNPEITRKQILGKIRSTYKLTPEMEQIYDKKDVERFTKLVESLNLEQPTRISIAAKLGVSYSAIVNMLIYLGLDDQYYSPENSSYDEEEMVDFIKSLGIDEIETQNKTLLEPNSYHNARRSIDIVLHEYKLGIEMDGIRYHSEFSGGKDKRYHQKKTDELEAKGYRLLHIFSNEWYNPTKKEIWKSIIRSKLGKIENKVHARKCVIDPAIEVSEAREFLNENHLSGFSAAKQHIGLYHDNELVGVLSIGKSRFHKDENEIIRFATKCNTSITGAFSKMIRHINPELKQNLISYADRRFSTRNCIYSQFATEISQTEPSWWGFSKNSELHHRLKFQKHILMQDPRWDDNKSTDDNFIAMGYDRIWDCGNWKYVLKLD